MPELPEVETVRRDLQREVVGRTVVGVAVTGARTVRRTSGAAVAAGLLGRRVDAVDRRGKYLILRLDDGRWLVVHLRMSGQVRVVPGAAPRAPHTHVVVALDDDRQLRFVDPRTFGEVVVVDPTTLEVPGLASLGWDPLLDPRQGPKVIAGLRRRHRQLKALLTDQHVIAGIGNIYSDEVLHCAGLRPERLADTLDDAEGEALLAAIHEVLTAAVAGRGSSLADQQYVDVDGRPGAYQDEHQVYGREGRPCRRCGATIVRTRWAGRSSYSCPACQR